MDIQVDIKQCKLLARETGYDFTQAESIRWGFTYKTTKKERMTVWQIILSDSKLLHKVYMQMFSVIQISEIDELRSKKLGRGNFNRRMNGEMKVKTAAWSIDCVEFR